MHTRPETDRDEWGGSEPARNPIQIVTKERNHLVVMIVGQDLAFRVILRDTCESTQETNHFVVICGKRFYSTAHLKIHSRVHTVEKPFCCETCGKKCTHQGSLKSHVMVHTGGKPFGCGVCGKRLNNKEVWGYIWKFTQDRNCTVHITALFFFFLFVFFF